jgi:uncharacterized glyoxalase superfamily protein PhnB
MSKSEMRKLSPVLIVDAIEPCLDFWVNRLGFAKTVEVPEGDRLGFVILAKDGVEVMYQSVESANKDIPALIGDRATKHIPSVGLFIEVSDINAVESAMRGADVVVPRRRTFYGMDEVGAREPAGHIVIFAQPAPQVAAAEV